MYNAVIMTAWQGQTFSSVMLECLEVLVCASLCAFVCSL